ncbi:MAG TPA: transcriptional repressor [Flavobacteriaceae bacterium]|nr:transcriptional repressor [Flavobacteriaceae bacterium]
MDKAKTVLHKKNVRPTAMRLLVYKALSENKTATSLTDLENNLETADRTTLYRTIKTFEEQCIVHPIEDGTGVTKYALCSPYCNEGEHKDLHLHFHCNVCEETSCLTEYSIPKISLPEHYIAQEVNFTVAGVCSKCNQS